MPQRPIQGRALLLMRDSGGEHETTPGQYVLAAQRVAKREGARFTGTPEQIKAMIAQGLAAQGDIFLDYGVRGSLLSRPGLNALFSEIERDAGVSHVIIPRRDRLARPEDPFDGAQLERRIRKLGVFVIVDGQTLPPIGRGAESDIATDITTLLDYRESRKGVRMLSEKVVYSQIERAERGFSCGGRAPYGMARYMVGPECSEPRLLEDGLSVKMKEHHVVFRPADPTQIAAVRRIYDELEQGRTAARVAAGLTADRVPTPDSGRTRTDNGIEHETSGVWQQTTVISIARNPIYCGRVRHGRRSMGYLTRFTPEGPRPLEDGDFRQDDNPKVVQNDASRIVEGQAWFDPVIDPERWDRVSRMLDERAGRQRGKPRSRTPGQDPLGCRVYDLDCGWTMYRTKRGQGFSYKCGLYQQSHGADVTRTRLTAPRRRSSS